MIMKELLREHKEVCSLTVDGRISEAAEIMRDKNVGSVVIVEDQQVVGIITDRDVAMALAFGAATPDSFVTEVMTRNVETVDDTMTLFDVCRYFRMAKVKRLPVLDKNDRLIGIVSVDDMMALLSREMFDTCSALEPKIGHMV